ncbi:MAG: DUF819 family protein [Melioribacteraceae bacterium]|jgi:uncharacterized membrane protein|nr:DUF819 family protein [Melioribacteraceae bacterium]
MIDQPFHILLIFTGIIALALFLSDNYKIAQKISPILIILFFSALLANLGVIRTDNPFYGAINSYAVPFAVTLILFHVRLSDLKNAGLPMLVAFGIGAVGSTVGSLTGGLILSGEFNSILPAEGWKIVGPYIGTYIGGSLNFFSLWTGLGIDNPNLFAAANAVDNLTFFPIFLFWIIAPNYLSKYFKSDDKWHQKEVDNLNEKDKTVSFIPTHIIGLTFSALLIMFLSKWIKVEFLSDWMPNLPTILIITTLALIAAQIKFVQKLQGSQHLGNLAFYLFFASVGAMMDIPKAIELAPILFLFVIIVILIQLSTVLILGKLLKLDIKVLAVAAVAAKLGPSSVIALTNSKNWNSLALPGIAAGLLGYAIGNYIGFAGAYFLKFMLGS